MPCLHFKIQRASLAGCPCHRLPAMRYAWLVNQQRREREIEIDSMGEKERKKCQFGQVLIIADATGLQRGRREREEGRSAAFWFLWWQLLCCMLHVARSQLAGVCVLLLLLQLLLPLLLLLHVACCS